MIRLSRAAAIIVALSGAATAPAAADVPLPFDLGGAYALTDHTGARRTEADPEGRAQLLFFGYAACLQICSAALPAMAETAQLLKAQGHDLQPLMITVNPSFDTVEAMGPALAKHSPDILGLTGTEAELAQAYDAFQVSFEEIFVDPEYGPVYAHDSFVYLLDGAGGLLTLLPPILSPEEMARIAAGYLDLRG